MTDFDTFDRKNFRKENIEHKKKNKKSVFDQKEDKKISKIQSKNIKKKIQEIREEELWEDWDSYL